MKKVEEPSEEVFKKYAQRIYSRNPLDVAVAKLIIQTWGYKGMHGGSYSHWWAECRWSMTKLIIRLYRVAKRLTFFKFIFVNCYTPKTLTGILTRFFFK